MVRLDKGSIQEVRESHEEDIEEVKESYKK